MEIDTAGDLYLQVYEHSAQHTFLSSAGVSRKSGCLVARMRVSRTVLKSNDYFKAQLSSYWTKPDRQAIDFCEKHIEAPEIWLRIFHETLTEKCYNVEIDDVWNAIQIGRKYLWSADHLITWFEKWLTHMGGSLEKLEAFDTEDLQQLLFPCHHLESAQGFATVTKRLAYEFCGHITERNPTRYIHLHLRNNIIGML